MRKIAVLACVVSLAMAITVSVQPVALLTAGHGDGELLNGGGWAGHGDGELLNGGGWAGHGDGELLNGGGWAGHGDGELLGAV